jgi:Flp pilus assembly pilin Flp
MKNSIQQIWREDDGVLSFEWVLLVTLLTIGVVAGIAGARDAIIDELADVSEAAISLDQSYFLAPLVLIDPDVIAFGSEYDDDTAADLAAFQSCDRTSAPAGEGPQIDVDS